MSRFYQADTGNWGFKWDGTHMAVFSLPGMSLEGIHVFEYRGTPEVHWGHAVCDEDPDYTYIYGLGEGKPYVARAVKGSITGNWEFYNGAGWSFIPDDAVPMADFQGSEQFSVFRIKNTYIFLSQGGGFSKDVFSFISDNPYTGWTNKKLLFTAHPPVEDPKLFVYNTVAHPQFIKDGQLLVSYNVNSFELEDLFKDARKYRPVFYRVPLELILE